MVLKSTFAAGAAVLIAAPLFAPLRAAPAPPAERAAVAIARPDSALHVRPTLLTQRRVRAVRPADLALATLRPRVQEQSHPQALQRALEAYYAYRAAHPEQVRKPYLYYVDYGLDNRTPRGYVFDMDALRVVEGPFPVAHGRGSRGGRRGVPARFSNVSGSAASSLGLYLTQETYGFRGTSAGRPYRSVGLRLRGLSGRFNSAARERGIVVHGAPYVTASRAGRSEGCPALEEDRAQRLLPEIARGSLVFLFSPHDPQWLRADPWAGQPLGMVLGAQE